ncbi:MAG: zeta toxin family protein [Candidatus Omnitrophica bacterium]|nr:zeta toxin family protein [Candidatus Omnitrophota bacterium]
MKIKRNKSVYIIAGPNGAGKTTFAKTFLPRYVKCQNFVNADLIANGLAPFAPETAALKAGKLLLKEIHEFASKGVDFSFETTLSGKSYINLFADLRKRGYALHLFFVWIPGVELGIARIKDRVAEGGHDVPLKDVKRRFPRSVNNFFTIYEHLLDSWMLFDNSKSEPILIAAKENNQILITDKCLFNLAQKSARQ